MLKKLLISLTFVLAGGLMLIFALLPIGVTKQTVGTVSHTTEIGVYDILVANSLSDEKLTEEYTKIATKLAMNPAYELTNKENAIKLELMQRTSRAQYDANSAQYDAIPAGLQHDAFFGILKMEIKFAQVSAETIALISVIGALVAFAVFYAFYSKKWVFWTTTAFAVSALALSVTILITMLSYSAALKTAVEASYALQSVTMKVTSTAGAAAILMPIFGLIAVLVPVVVELIMKSKTQKLEVAKTEKVSVAKIAVPEKTPAKITKVVTKAPAKKIVKKSTSKSAPKKSTKKA